MIRILSFSIHFNCNMVLILQACHSTYRLQPIPLAKGICTMVQMLTEEFSGEMIYEMDHIVFSSAYLNNRITFLFLVVGFYCSNEWLIPTKPMHYVAKRYLSTGTHVDKR